MRALVALGALAACARARDDAAADAGAPALAAVSSPCRANADCATGTCSGAGVCACPHEMAAVAHGDGVAPRVSCIDGHEVTNAEYADFVAACPDGCPKLMPLRCNADTNLAARTAETTDPFAESSVNCFREDQPARVGAGYEGYPVVCIDWCAAWAYCAWKGKRLCGKLDGAPSSSEWVDACAGSRKSDYAYAPAYDACACNARDANGDAITCPDGSARGADMVSVGGPASCVAESGALDLNGNAAEWDADCAEDPTQSAQDKCTVRGGSYASTPKESTCTSTDKLERSHASSVVGFRCCSG